MLDMITEITDFLWGLPLTIFVVCVGIYMCVCCKFFQLTKIKHIFRSTVGKLIDNKNKTDDDKKTISMVLAGTIGTGNIAGIASAIAVGGPGAIFWMWIISFISMATKMAEVTLSVKYRKKKEDGTYSGGPMYYIKQVSGKLGKILAVVYSVSLLTYVITDSCFAQMNTLATTINETFKVPLILIGIIAIGISIIIINKGLDKMGIFLKRIVPVMTLIYLISAILIVIINITKIPNVLIDIIKYAFQPAPVMGGFAGATIMMAISKGAARGIFANEAGLGTSATVYATQKNAKPVEQGMWGIFEVAVVSFVTCTLTALLIMVTGSISTGNSGAVLVLDAFQTIYGNYGKVILSIIIALFAYTSYLGYFIEFKTSITYLFGENKFKYLKWIYYIPVIFAVLLPIDAIWALADISVGFIIIPNLIALILLGTKFKNIIKEYNVS